MSTRRELGRGDRVLPGLWRLRLPLPWPGVPHGNAWAIAAGPGVVLVDTGYHEPGSIAQLERAMDQVNLRLEHVQLVAATHAHSDHWGQAATIVDRAGCEFWMHPNHEHATRSADDPEATLARRLEVARQSGVPQAALDRYLERFSQGMPSGIARVIEPDRPLVDGVQIETDLGTWTAYETPGHAPSHVCLYQPERRLLISGDHVRLGLSGHGRPFVDVHGHIESCRRLAHERLDAVRGALREGPHTAVEIAPDVHGQPLNERNASWFLSETLSYLRHLERLREVASEPDGDAVQWRATQP
jgi:glyoxylase-like metal-dependent hydrolase (beta-lactamase superfamily II)